MRWHRVVGAHVGRDEGEMVCITLDMFTDASPTIGFMADEKTLRKIGEGLVHVSKQMRARTKGTPRPRTRRKK